MTPPVAARASSANVSERIDAFVEAFNRNDLDMVMTFFADDAVYRPGDGKEHRGRAAIRTAFEPQFAGAYGKMLFDEYDRLIDETSRKATIRWTCHHDFTGSYGDAMPPVRRWFFRALLRSTRAGWHGLDVFHFDDEGMIKGKFSYAESSRPLLKPELGRRL